MSKKCANVPMAARVIKINQPLKFRELQKKGTIKLITIAPDKPVKISEIAKKITIGIYGKKIFEDIPNAI